MYTKKGEPGKRFALPNASIMIHQPSGGAAGQASDIAIHAREILRVRERLNRIYQKHTGIRDIETIGMHIGDFENNQYTFLTIVIFIIRKNGRERLLHDCRGSFELWFDR